MYKNITKCSNCSLFQDKKCITGIVKKFHELDKVYYDEYGNPVIQDRCNHIRTQKWYDKQEDKSVDKLLEKINKEIEISCDIILPIMTDAPEFDEHKKMLIKSLKSIVKSKVKPKWVFIVTNNKKYAKYTKDLYDLMDEILSPVSIRARVNHSFNSEASVHELVDETDRRIKSIYYMVLQPGIELEDSLTNLNSSVNVDLKHVNIAYDQNKYAVFRKLHNVLKISSKNVVEEALKRDEKEKEILEENNAKYHKTIFTWDELK